MKKVNALLIGLLVLGFLVVGTGASFKLMKVSFANHIIMGGLAMELVAAVVIIWRLAERKRMKQSAAPAQISIHQIEQIRYRTLLGLTIGFTLNYLAGTLFYLGWANTLVLATAIVAGLAGWIIFVVYILKLMDLKEIARNDQRVHRILNDELAHVARLKAYRTGFWSFVISVGLSIFAVAMSSLPAIAALRIILLAGVGAALVYGLILLRPITDREG